MALDTLFFVLTSLIFCPLALIVSKPTFIIIIIIIIFWFGTRLMAEEESQDRGRDTKMTRQGTMGVFLTLSLGFSEKEAGGGSGVKF